MRLVATNEAEILVQQQVLTLNRHGNIEETVFNFDAQVMILAIRLIFGVTKEQTTVSFSLWK